MTFTKKNDEAVSPVIGVILMVAITVILAAVIAAFVFGMAGNIQTAKNIGVTASAKGTDVIITYQGGTDDPSLTYLKATSTPAGGTAVIRYSTAAAQSASVGAATKPAVGTKMTLPAGKTANIQSTVIVVAHWADGTETIVLDTKL